MIIYHSRLLLILFLVYCCLLSLLHWPTTTATAAAAGAELPARIIPRRLQLLTSLNYNLHLSNDLLATGGAIAVAVDNVNRQYAGWLTLDVDHLYNASDRTCDAVASHAARMLAQHYYRTARADTCYAIVTSRKDFTRGAHNIEWRVVYM